MGGCIHLVRFVGVTLAQSLHQELERQSGRLGGRQGRRKEILSILRQCLLNTLKTPQLCALCLQIDSLSSPHIDLSANKPSFTLHNPKEGEKDRIVEDDGEHSKSIPGALSSTVIVWLRFSMLPFILGHLISP